MSTVHEHHQHRTMFTTTVQGIPYPPPPAFNDNGMIIQQLKNQIDFYFRPENLANDQYLLSHLHATEHLGAVPIQVLCHFPKVRQLYALARFGQHVPAEMAPAADPSFLTLAMKGSSVVKVSDDGMWVLPNTVPEQQPQLQQSSWTPSPSSQPTAEAESSEVSKETSSTTVVTTNTEATAPASPSSQTTGSSSVGVPTHPLPVPKERDTVILRDIPASVTEETILEVFTTAEHGTPKSARPEIGNTWYVTFESEEHAVAAMAASREKTIDGAPIRGHLKSELAASANKDSQQRIAVPPSMFLPPPVIVQHQPQDAATATSGAPLHPPTQVPYYPVQHSMMAQQGYGYGYVHYGYATPSVHQHQQFGYPVQQRYLYGYVRPPHQHQQNRPQHNQSGNRPDSRNGNSGSPSAASSPPSSVYVRPNNQNKSNPQQNGQQRDNNGANTNNNNNSRKRNQNKKRNHKNRNNSSNQPQGDNQGDSSQNTNNNTGGNGGTQATNKNATGTAPQQMQQHQPQQQQKQRTESVHNRSKNGGDNKNSQQQQQQQTNNAATNGSKKPWKDKVRRGSKKYNNNYYDNSKKNQERIDMGVEHFPALGGGKAMPSKPKSYPNLPSKPGYAEALLKRHKPPGTKDLESSMNNLGFEDVVGSEAYDEW